MYIYMLTTASVDKALLTKSRDSFYYNVTDKPDLSVSYGNSCITALPAG